MGADVRHGERAVIDASATRAGYLYERYAPRILAYCLHALRDREEAEDAVQTTFLRAQSALRRGVAPEYEFAWLHSIATNVCRMQKRTAARRGAVTGVDLDAFPGPDQGSDGDTELLFGLDDALASLPEAQRRALLLREWHGLSSGEVASRLGLSPSATYALLTRARRSMAQALTALPRRPLLGLDVGPLLLRLKALLAGGGAKAAAAAGIAATVAVGGATVERALAEPPTRTSPAAASAPRSGVAHASGRSPAGVADVRDVTAVTLVGARALRGSERAGARARARTGGDTRPAADGPGPTDPQVTPTDRDEPGAAPPEATRVDDPPTTPLDDTLEAADDVVDELVDDLPLPEPDLDVVTGVVPEEPLPGVDEILPPTEPLPELPPAPLPPGLPPLP